MTEIVDFANEKMKREVGPSCRMVMDDGTVLYKFGADYRFPEGACAGGGTFTVYFWARSLAEAGKHVQAMHESLTEPHQVYDVIPA
jgi:hypothetical protein